MKSNVAILVALLVVLVIIVAYLGRNWIKGWMKGWADGFAPGGNYGQGAAHVPFGPGKYNPYTVLNKELDAIRGYRNDGYNQPPIYHLPRGLDAYHRSGAHLSPEQVADAEREQWYAALETDRAGQFNTELAQDASADTFQYHSPAPAIDYDTFITDLVVDPRTRDNHRRWVEEMKPWSGTAMKIDDLDLEPYVDFIGLRRPQAVVQYNPLQLTEVDTYDLSKNKRFNFQG